MILTSHNMADIEQVCERLVIISRGRVVYDGSIRDLSRMSGLRKQIRVTLGQAERRWSASQSSGR